MKVSLNWLKDYVDIDISTDVLMNKFNLMSAEVEQLEKMVSATSLVVGAILTCVPHPDSDHLYVCAVDVGNAILQIVCGAPNVAAGQKVVVALEGGVLPGDLKIKKTKIRGVDSTGMICSLEELGIEKKYHSEDGIHVLPATSIPGTDALKALHFDGEILELDPTPNRGDLLSLLGVAYEVSAMLGTNLHIERPAVSEAAESNRVVVSTTTDKCLSYYARVIRNVQIHESPDWMKARLIATGIRPINNVVDITNYVMMTCGQPLHAFDFDKLKTGKIVVRSAIKGEIIVTLDEKVRLLVADDIVITDGSRPVALAGIMGGLETEIDDTTKNILLESAVFDPISIRKTSKRLDLRSESSIRFERRIDPNRTILALDRASSLLQQLAFGTVLSGVSSFDHNRLNPKPIELTLQMINKVTGIAYESSTLEDVFRRLRFDYELSDDGRFVVQAPTRRPDLLTYQDLIEEVVRIHGYSHVPTSLPKVPSNGFLTKRQSFRRLLRDTLASLGLDETITYSLVTEAKAVEFDLISKPVVRLSYPMAEDRSVLRHSLLPSMLDCAVYNTFRKNDQIALFEIGKGYTLHNETEYVAGVLSGTFQASSWKQKSEPVDFYLVKGLLTTLFDRIGLTGATFTVPETPDPNLHPGISATIWKGTTRIGRIGKLHPMVQAARNLRDTCVFELGFDELFAMATPNSHMSEIAKYPAVSRDIAILVERGISAGSILEVVQRAGKKVLESVKIFDVYVGDQVGADQKSIALSLTFQDYSKTLETEEIDRMTGRIIKALKQELNADMRS